MAAFDIAAAAPASDDTGEKTKGGLSADAIIELFAIPVIVVLGFVAYAIWHATATLDSVQASSLAWGTIWQQIYEHVKLNYN